jgi:prepilin signal peptidase PulO-like enzyme (type II secretory pathway)
MFLLAFYFLVLMLLSSYLLKKDTMGYGDIILISVTTFWMGLIDGLLIIFFASLFSIVHWLILKITSSNEKIILPFGSTVSLAAILIFIIKHTLQFDTNLF